MLNTVLKEAMERMMASWHQYRVASNPVAAAHATLDSFPEGHGSRKTYHDYCTKLDLAPTEEQIQVLCMAAAVASKRGFFSGELVLHALTEGRNAVTRYSEFLHWSGNAFPSQHSMGSTAGLQFPPEHLLHHAEKFGYSGMCPATAVFLAGVLEYYAAEVLECSGRVTSSKTWRSDYDPNYDRKMRSIRDETRLWWQEPSQQRKALTRSAIQIAITGDPELLEGVLAACLVLAPKPPPEAGTRDEEQATICVSIQPEEGDSLTVLNVHPEDIVGDALQQLTLHGVGPPNTRLHAMFGIKRQQGELTFLGGKSVLREDSFDENGIEDGARLELRTAELQCYEETTGAEEFENILQALCVLNHSLDIDEARDRACWARKKTGEGTELMLRSWDLSDLDLKELPASMGTLRLKTDLNLFRNDLESIPEALAGLTLGGSLILSCNRITELPAGFGRLDESVGDKVRLDGNPIAKGALGRALRSDWVHTIPAHLTSMRALEFGENPHAVYAAIRIRDDEDYDSDGGCDTDTDLDHSMSHHQPERWWEEGRFYYDLDADREP